MSQNIPSTSAREIRGRWARFYDCSVSEKLLYTSYLLLIGLAYLFALTYLYQVHVGHAGKPGHFGVEDIVANYYGNRSGTRLESAIRGPMASFVTTAEDRSKIVSWLKSGAPEQDYDPVIRPILAKTCLNCHNPAVGQKPDMTTFKGVKEVAAVDTGESYRTLVKLSHIHLFGISLVLLSVGLIFRLSEFNPLLKRTMMVLPFAAVLADIASWYLTKWDPIYAYTVIISGAVLGLALAAQILISLYQIWFLKPPQADMSKSVGDAAAL
jgi:hypothetical protein